MSGALKGSRGKHRGWMAMTHRPQLHILATPACPALLSHHQHHLRILSAGQFQILSVSRTTGLITLVVSKLDKSYPCEESLLFWKSLAVLVDKVDFTLFTYLHFAVCW